LFFFFHFLVFKSKFDKSAIKKMRVKWLSWALPLISSRQIGIGIGTFPNVGGCQGFKGPIPPPFLISNANVGIDLFCFAIFRVFLL